MALFRRFFYKKPPDRLLEISERVYELDYIIIRLLPLYNNGRGSRPVVHVYGQDPSLVKSNKSSKLLFAFPKAIGVEVYSCLYQVLFLDADALPSIITLEEPSEDNESETEVASPDEFFKVDEIFSSIVDGHEGRVSSDTPTARESVQNDKSSEPVLKEGLEHHSFLDCASDEGTRRHDGRIGSNYRASKSSPIGNENEVLVSINVDPKFSPAASKKQPLANSTTSADAFGSKNESKHQESQAVFPVHGKLDEEENNQDEESISTQELERQGLEQKMDADSNKQQCDNVPPAAPKKQPLANSTTSVDPFGAKNESKQQESQGSLSRQAKPKTISWQMASSEGSYTNLIHVSDPPSRCNSAPPALALDKDFQSQGKPKAPSPCASPEIFAPINDSIFMAGCVAKHSSCPASLDISTAKIASIVASSTSLPQDLQVHPPPPPPPPLPTWYTNSLSSQVPYEQQLAEINSSPLPTLYFPQQASHSTTVSSLGLIPPPPPLPTLLLFSTCVAVGTTSPPLPVAQPPALPLPQGAPGPPGGAPPPPGRGGPGRGRGLPGRAGTAKRSKELCWNNVARALQRSWWEELQRRGEPQVALEIDVKEIEALFSATVPKSSKDKSGGKQKAVGSKPDKIHLIDLRRANNTEIMLTKVKMPLPDMMAAALAMDESILDADQVENLIKFCPTKEEMDQLKNYTGDKEMLGKCEQFFLELIKVPRVESKLKVFLFKIQFNTQVADFRKSLTWVNSSCEEVRNSVKFKDIMKKILYLVNTLNQGTARGAAVGFKLDSLLKLTDTGASNRMTLMHYLCKALADEMQTITRGFDKVKQELVASESDGPVSETFLKTLKEFIGTAEAEVASFTNLYAVAARNLHSLARFIGLCSSL
ncbi:PREDICTED: formin-like protein 20 [Ipomoea nil]|uniref:formin-like protein 20 n=1 Tax=Ipomoea nil TaxID=35883 RepID=UPI0009019B35|nr:PREDICTED: formin-like protein 20 [Ipomoea nil]